MILNVYRITPPENVENPVEWASNFCTKDNWIMNNFGSLYVKVLDPGVFTAEGAEFIEQEITE